MCRGRRNLSRPAAAFTAVVVCALALGAWAFAIPGDARAIGRGIIDNRLETAAEVDLAAIPAMAAEMGPSRLRARWTRVMVHWNRLQPSAPGVASSGDADGDGYDDAYVLELDTTIGALHANGVKVILTFQDVPQWASNEALWKDPPDGMAAGYSSIYAMDVGDPAVLAGFQGMAAFLAGRYAGAADYLECWNEPNTGGSLYPQSRSGSRYFGARTYAKMLRAFHAGVESAATGAVVIAGGTAPRGADDKFSTSPRTFAAYIRKNVAGRYFDAYSHHPYQQGDRKNAAPHLPPPNKRKTVSLGNLDVLLKLFPKKDFYLTEFGYNTKKPALFGMTVSEASQARYLRDAYAFAARTYPQVKAILWFMVEDLPAAGDRCGAWMGLRHAGGTRKPGWFAFASGNTLAIQAPSSARKGRVFAISGHLTSRAFGSLDGKTVTLQVRRAGQKRWRAAKHRVTGAGGGYSFRTAQTAASSYRVVWDGVCESRTARVRTP